MKIGEVLALPYNNTASFKNSNCPERINMKVVITASAGFFTQLNAFDKLREIMINTKLTNKSKSLILNSSLFDLCLASQDEFGFFNITIVAGTIIECDLSIRQALGMVADDWQIDVTNQLTAVGAVTFTLTSCFVYGFSNNLANQAIAYTPNIFSSEQTFDIPVTPSVLKIMINGTFERINLKYALREEELEQKEAMIMNTTMDELAAVITDASTNINSIFTMHNFGRIMVENEETLSNIRVKLTSAMTAVQTLTMELV